MMRLFTSADFDACVDLYITTFAGPPWNETWDRQLVRDRLSQIVETPGFFGAVIEGEPLTGFVLGTSEPWHEGTHFNLKEMCIRPGLQRQGLGTKLLEYLAKQLETRDTKRIYLLTARGDITEAFYTKAGFYTSPKMILMARRFEQPA